MIKLVFTFTETSPGQVQMKDRIKSTNTMTPAEIKASSSIQGLVREYIASLTEKAKEGK